MISLPEDCTIAFANQVAKVVQAKVVQAKVVQADASDSSGGALVFDGRRTERADLTLVQILLAVETSGQSVQIIHASGALQELLRLYCLHRWCVEG